MVDAGDFVFMLIVIYINLKVLISSYLINWGIVILVFGSILVYFLCYVILSETAMFADDDHFGSLNHLFTFPTVIIGSYFFLSTFTLLDLALERAYILVK